MSDTMKPDVQTKIRNYLLGQGDEAELDAIEETLITDAGLFDELLVVEDEIIDEYLNGKLSPEARSHFEKYFLVSPERTEQLKFARAFRRYVSSHDSDTLLDSTPSNSWLKWTQSLYRSPVRAAACAVLIVGVALGVWQISFRQSEVDKGLVALKAAYREERPIEARISSLNYAPFITTRGVNPERVDQAELRRAELTLLDAIEKRPSAATQHALGQVFLAKREFDKAIEYFDAGISGDPNNAQLYADLGAAWLEKGKLDLLGAEPGKGMEELGRGLENLNRALGLNPNLLQALFNRGLCKEHLTAYSEAENDWREYLDKDKRTPWADEARRRLQLLEEKKKRRSQTKEELFKNFIQAYESGNQDEAWSALSLSRGRTGNVIVEALLDDYFRLWSEIRNHEAGIALQKLAFAGEVEQRKVGDAFTRDLVETLRLASAVQKRRIHEGRQLLKQAIERYNKTQFKEASEILSTAGNKFLESGDEAHHMFAEAWIGYCYLRIPEPEKALQLFQRLSQSFAAKNYKSMLAQSLLAQADAHNGKIEFSKVLKRASESLVLSQQIDDKANSVRCLQAGTSVYLIMGDYTESLSATFRALELIEEIPPDSKLAWPFYHEASLAFYFLGLPTAALLFENQSLRVATTSGLMFQASRSYDRLALLQLRLANHDEAIRNSELARQQSQNIDDKKTRSNILAHASMNLGRIYLEKGDAKQALDSFQESMDLYEQLNMNIYRYPGHKGKTLALMKLNYNDAAQIELDSTIYWFEQNREKIAEERLRDKFFDTEQDTYDLAIDFTFSKRNEKVQSLKLAEASRARTLFDLMTTGSRVSRDSQAPELRLASVTPTLSVKEIQQRLPEHSQLLEYSVLPNKTIIWVVTRNSVESATTTIQKDELTQKTQRYLQLLTRASPNKSEVSGMAQELYAKLITPAERYLDKNLKLCVIPDDKLNFVPFASLVSPNSGRYLIEDYALQVAPSATVFISSSENAKLIRSRGPERLLAIGNPSFDRKQFSSLPDLPSAKLEVEGIATLYGGTPLTGNTATVSRVRSSLTEADVVHFATHAVTDDDSPLLSKLLLAITHDEMNHASSAYLTAADIFQIKLNHLRLAVLSACQTGVEKTYRGEGAIGLARPFIAARVPLVVASLWPVESEATANLMISFHKHRKLDHVSTVESLRRAQLEAIHNPQVNSQFNWAAFVVIGGDADF